MKLSNLIITSLAFWTALFFIFHGSVVLYYLLIQSITSGIFAYGFYKTEKDSKNGN